MLLVAVVFDLSFILFVDPVKAFCPDCAPDLNSLLIEHRPDVLQFLLTYVAPVGMSFVLLAAGIVVVHFARGTTPQRRAILPMLPLVLMTTFFVSVFPYLLLGTKIVPSPAEIALLGALQEVSLLLLPAAIAFGALRGRGRRRQVRMSDLVLALTDVPSAQRLQGAVSRALGDPSVLVGVWRPDVATFVGPDGLPLDPPAVDSGREATYLNRADGPLAVVVHDQALLDDPGLLASVTAAVRLAIDNDRLQEEVLTQLREVQESRTRIVEAAYAERKRLERDLHDGAQQRLVSTALALRMARTSVQDPDVDAQLDAAVQELQAAIGELRDLARGMYPAVLADEGLPAALWSLADRCPVPTSVGSVPTQRLAPAVEAAAYFVVAEALTNVAKYAEATRVDVSVTVEDGILAVEVVDDGKGGARATTGGGLAGLRDRVSALGGELLIDSPQGAGTRLLAQLPVPVETPASVAV
jgi:signal transduction histidine kinase